jgi:hypothetical protein
MAINILYQPSASALAGVALAGGQGLFKQRQTERSDGINRMLIGAALQDRQQRAGFAMDQARMAAQMQAQQQSQLMDAYTMSLRAAQQQQAFQAEQANRAAEMEAEYAYKGAFSQQQLQQQRELQEMELGQQTALTKMRYGMENDQLNQRQTMAWETGGVEAQEQQIAALQGEMSKNSQNLTPEGRRIYNDLSSKLSAIQRQRTQLRPQQYGQLLGQWQEEFARSGVSNHIQTPPTPEQTWKENSIPLEGGGFAVREPNGKGGFVWKELGKPQSKGSGAGNRRTSTFEDYYEDPTDYWKDLGALRKEMHAEAVREAKAKPGAAMKPPEVIEGSVPMPTDQEVEAAMRKRFGEWRSRVAPKAPTADTSTSPFQMGADGFTGAALPAVPGQVAPLQGAMGDLVDETMAGVVKDNPNSIDARLATLQIQDGQGNVVPLDPGVREGLTPELVQEFAAKGSQDPIADAALFVHNLLNMKQPEPAAPKPQKAFDKFLPQPKTEAEFAALPPGSVFIDPEGKRRRKP